MARLAVAVTVTVYRGFCTKVLYLHSNELGSHVYALLYTKTAFARQKWRKLFKLMMHSVQSALEKLAGE